MSERKLYKFPRYWLGAKVPQPVWKDGEIVMEEITITEAMINPACRCATPLQSTFCAEGHVTECHVGMSCAVANCSHMDRYE